MSRHPVIDSATCAYMHIMQCQREAAVLAVLLPPGDDGMPRVYTARTNIDISTCPFAKVEPLGPYSYLFQ